MTDTAPLTSPHNRGTWDDPAIWTDARVDDGNPLVRAVAEDLHRNESTHMHWYVGAVVCPYCALRASRAVRLMLNRAKVECTGITARWCPVCGDCTCADRDSDYPELDDPTCVLHRTESTHGEMAAS